MRIDFDLEEVIALVADSLRASADKNREPRIVHPLRVMCRLEEPLEMATAVLYHAYKNGGCTLAGLARRGAPRESIRAIEILENSCDTNKRENILRIASNPLAAAVKRAELAEDIRIRENLSDPETSEKNRQVLDFLCSASQMGELRLEGFIRDPESGVFLHAATLDDEDDDYDYDRKNKDEDGRVSGEEEPGYDDPDLEGPLN